MKTSNPFFEPGHFPVPVTLLASVALFIAATEWLVAHVRQGRSSRLKPVSRDFAKRFCIQVRIP